MDRSNFLKRALGVSLLPFVPRTLTPETPALEAIQPQVYESFGGVKYAVAYSSAATATWCGYATGIRLYESGNV